MQTQNINNNPFKVNGALNPASFQSVQGSADGENSLSPLLGNLNPQQLPVSPQTARPFILMPYDFVNKLVSTVLRYTLRMFEKMLAFLGQNRGINTSPLQADSSVPVAPQQTSSTSSTSAGAQGVKETSFTSKFENIAEGLSSAAEGIANVWSLIKDSASTIWNTAKKVVSPIWKGIKGVLGKGIKFVSPLVSKIPLVGGLIGKGISLLGKLF
ncbi:MAG: hypothetical protein D6780_03935 [Candidatus Dadabacteria bacterium]|nr:MAG: hypothetical protein D6780_03935 [Candidatus Dadabacteria bacterium]